MRAKCDVLRCKEPAAGRVVYRNFRKRTGEIVTVQDRPLCTDHLPPVVSGHDTIEPLT